MNSPRINPVILSGGAGTRLWPLSTAARPKQLLALIADRTMLQGTALRVADPGMFAPPILVSGQDYAGAAEAQLAEVGVNAARLILEPCSRNTAPAVTLAALEAGPEALLLVMPSDHVVADAEAFRGAVTKGIGLAEQGWLVTFGICADRAETGYGYIKRGEAIGPGAFRADNFIEKPDRETAAQYVAKGCYDWNGGIFLFRASTFLSELRRYAPDILAACKAALSGAARDGVRIRPDADSFGAVRAQSIDHAVMEKAESIAVVPVEMGWSDVGSWDAVFDISSRDEAGNVIEGNVTQIESSSCLLRSDGPKLIAIGLSDLIAVAAGDAILLMPRGESQRVREAVDALRNGASPAAAGEAKIR